VKELLELRDVTKIFKVGGGLGVLGAGKYIKAVENISFVLPSAEPQVTAIVGESGSGKTTIARLILGLLRPTSGEILYMGKDIFEMLKDNPKEYRRNVQAIFQDPYAVFNPFYRVERVLKVVIEKFNLASNSEEAESKIIESLEAMGLRPQDIIGRYPHQLSGGERQRLMLARAFLIKPRLLIADEPVSMLDVSLRAIFLNKLIELKNKLGTSCLYITHDLNIAHYIADKALILCHGKIIEEGDMKTIINEPLHPYTKLLVDSIPKPNPKERWRERLKTDVIGFKELRVKKGCPFNLRCPFASEKCYEKTPSLIEVKPDRKVACFLYES